MTLMCCVPLCNSKPIFGHNEHRFYTLPDPDPESDSKDSLRNKRRRQWIDAIFGTPCGERFSFDLIVCSRHFVSGSPAKDTDVEHVDWIPSLELPVVSVRNKQAVDNIIDNLPEVVTTFDIPEYILLTGNKFKETDIENRLVKKYITNPSCDENGYYNNDHDYLGLPIAPTKTELRQNGQNCDHTYALADRPACHYFDSRHFCNICSCICSNIFSFNKHLMAHTMRNLVTCKFCFRTYLTSTCLNNHLNVHTTHCDKCGNEVPTVQFKAHQLVNRKQKYKHPDSKRYKFPRKLHFCVKCMMGSYDLKKFENHLCFKKLKMRRKLRML